VIKHRWLSVLVLLLIVGAPTLGHACAVCFEANDKNRAAFFATTIFLSLLPLGMIGGSYLWLRRRAQELRGNAASDGILPLGER
jgi:hypothetical protein